MRHPTNLGQGAAIETGIQYALRVPAVAYVVTFDADGQHGSRTPGDGHAARPRASRWCSGHGSYGATRHRAPPRGDGPARRRDVHPADDGLHVTDAHNGLRVLRRDAAERWPCGCTGCRTPARSCPWSPGADFSVAEHPVTVSYSAYSRAKGQRGYNALNIVFELAVDGLRPAS